MSNIENANGGTSRVNQGGESSEIPWYKSAPQKTKEHEALFMASSVALDFLQNGDPELAKNVLEKGLEPYSRRHSRRETEANYTRRLH